MQVIYSRTSPYLIVTKFAYRNPSCNEIHGYFLNVEKKLRILTAEAERHSSPVNSDMMTEKRTADYICYPSHHQSTSELKLVAILMEIKTDSNYNCSSIAQLIEYHLGACKKRQRRTSICSYFLFQKVAKGNLDKLYRIF